MSNLIKDLIPLFGETQIVSGRPIKDERLKLFIWMISDDWSRMNKYLQHGDGTTWLKSAAKNGAYPYLMRTDLDPEINVLINDFATRVQTLDKVSVITNLNKLAGKDLDFTARKIISGLFRTINGNSAREDDSTYKIPSPVTECTYNSVPLILQNFFYASDYSVPIPILKSFIEECHARSPLIFTYQMGEYLARRILQDHATANVSVGSTFLTDLDSKLAEPTHEFYRKPEDLSKLWTKENGVEVEVQRESQRMRDVTRNPADCHGHKVISNGAETCHKYLEECLNGNSIDKCRNFMKNPIFWGNGAGGAKTEVNGMLPATALATLEKFGFRKLSVFDNIAKRNIYKVETVSSWLENLSKTIADINEYKAIKDNGNLIQYLSLLEVKINSSPEILNKGITSSDGTQPFNPNKFAGQFASQVGIRAKLPNTYSGLHARHVNTLINSGVIGLPKLVIPFVLSSMRGGNNMVGGDVSDYVSNMLIDDNKDTKFVAFEYENMYNSYKNALKGMNKTIDPVDDKELQKLITSFKNTEKKAFVSLRLIKKYIELMDIFKYNDPNQVLTLSNLDLLVSTNKSQLDKGTKKQESLTNALNTLASVVEKAVNGVNPTSAGLGSYNGSSFSHDN